MTGEMKEKIFVFQTGKNDDKVDAMTIRKYYKNLSNEKNKQLNGTIVLKLLSREEKISTRLVTKYLT